MYTLHEPGDKHMLVKPLPLSVPFVCSVAQLCPTLCDPMDCSTPDPLVPHHLPELAQVHFCDKDT